MSALSKYKTYPEYKDSGVEWLGKIPSVWDLERGKTLFSTIRISAYSDDEQLAASQKFGVIPQKLMMELNDAKVMLALKGTDSFRHVETHNFVISLRSFEGGIEHSAYTGCVSPAYTVLEAKENIDPYFFKYLFKSKPFISVLQATTDSLRDGKSISYEQFGAIQLPNITIHEQTNIAQFLDHETVKIDQLIEKQQTLIELLKEKRQAVISHAVTKGLDPNVKMKDSGVEWLGEVPEHWEVKRLKQLIHGSLTYGANESADDDNPLNPRYIRITDMNNDGTLNSDTFRSLPNDIAQPYLLEDFDILLARSGATVGKSFMYQKIFGTCCFAGYLIRARINSNLAIPTYIYNFCQTKSYWKYIESSQIQATIQNVSAEKYGEMFVPIPTTEEQREIINFLNIQNSKIDLLIQKAEQQIDLMKERRTALISAAVTGKIDVRDWQPEQ